MTLVRLFIDADLMAGADIIATPAQAHHLGTVMRRHAGDPVLLFNGRDGEWRATIKSISRNRALLVPEQLVRSQAPGPDIWLFFALLKRDATDFVVEKATELGAARLLPVITERTIAARVNESRLRAIAISAAEQCERLTVPEITRPAPLLHVLAGCPPHRQVFAAVERSSAPLLRPATGPKALLVGPEGGFARAELDALRHYPFVALARLGPNVLRAETACVAGLAILQASGCG